MMKKIVPEVLIEDLDNIRFVFYDIFDIKHDSEFDKIDIIKETMSNEAYI